MVFFELFNASNNYYEPKKFHEIKSIKQKEFFPTFGNSNLRLKWTNQFNNVIRKTLIDKRIDFINTYKFLDKDRITNESKDGIHITSEKVIYKINKQIVEKINSKYGKNIK